MLLHCAMNVGLRAEQPLSRNRPHTCNSPATSLSQKVRRVAANHPMEVPMRRALAAAATLAAVAVTGPLCHAQTVYPIERADSLVGSRFAVKLEFPGLVDQAKITVTVNGEDHQKVFGRAAVFIEREDGKDLSAMILRDVALTQPGSYRVRVSDGTQSREVGWTVYATG